MRKARLVTVLGWGSLWIKYESNISRQTEGAHRTVFGENVPGECFQGFQCISGAQHTPGNFPLHFSLHWEVESSTDFEWKVMTLMYGREINLRAWLYCIMRMLVPQAEVCKGPSSIPFSIILSAPPTRPLFKQPPNTVRLAWFTALAILSPLLLQEWEPEKFCVLCVC